MVGSIGAAGCDIRAGSARQYASACHCLHAHTRSRERAEETSVADLIGLPCAVCPGRCASGGTSRRPGKDVIITQRGREGDSARTTKATAAPSLPQQQQQQQQHTYYAAESLISLAGSAGAEGPYCCQYACQFSGRRRRSTNYLLLFASSHGTSLSSLHSRLLLPSPSTRGSPAQYRRNAAVGNHL